MCFELYKLERDLSICCVEEIIEFKIQGGEDQNNFIYKNLQHCILLLLLYLWIESEPRESQKLTPGVDIHASLTITFCMECLECLQCYTFDKIRVPNSSYFFFSEIQVLEAL
jgi:hypothetical protein